MTPCRKSVIYEKHTAPNSAYSFSEAIAMKQAGHPDWLEAMRAAIKAGAWCSPVWRAPR